MGSAIKATTLENSADMNTIEIIEADLTTLDVDAIVNAANAQLRGGGGVDGAIHRAAGPELLQACLKLGGCATGSAKITKGYKLPARYVIHAVGPVWKGGQHNEAGLLASCYTTSLRLAVENQLLSVAFPAISCGAYGFPVDKACAIAVDTVAGFLKDNDSIEKVIFCCFGDTVKVALSNALARHKNT